MAATRSRVAAGSRPRPLSASDTVVVDTPAARATSSRVIGRDAFIKLNRIAAGRWPGRCAQLTGTFLQIIAGTFLYVLQSSSPWPTAQRSRRDRAAHPIGT